MIVIRRKKDREIVHDLSLNDWDDSRHAKELQTKINELNALPKGTPAEIKAPFEISIAEKQKRRDQWVQNRIHAVMQKYGGDFQSYEALKVPEELVLKASKARYISCDEEDNFFIENAPLVSIDGAKIIISAGWMSGNYRLMEDDVTDFLPLDIDEPVEFKLCAYRQGDIVSIDVFLCEKDEDFPNLDMPNKIFLSTVCHGVVYPDKKIELI